MANLNATVSVVKGQTGYFHGEGYRPCAVNGEQALFHCWAQKEYAILKFNMALKTLDKEEILKNFELKRYVPAGVDMEKLSCVVAIVEFKDGTVAEVELDNLQFLDSEAIFLKVEKR